VRIDARQSQKGILRIALSEIGNVMIAQFSLIDELQDAIEGSSETKRVETLRQVTDLFLSANRKLSEKQVAVFDNVLVHLVENVSNNGLAELSERLQEINNAPINTIRRLANDDSIAVAGPVLTRSTRLTSTDLVDIVQRKSEAHRYAISERVELDETLTSALIEYGEARVLHRLSSNAGARFSEEGFAALLRKSEGRDEILEALGLRTDLPHAILRDVISKANETLREKLLADAPAAVRASIEEVLSLLSATVENSERRQKAARQVVQEANRAGFLNESTVLNYANFRQKDELTAALEIMTGSKFDFVQRALASEMRESTLIVCKAAGLGWPVAHAALKLNPAKLSASDLAALEHSYSKLTVPAAQRTLRFWQVKNSLAS